MGQKGFRENKWNQNSFKSGLQSDTQHAQICFTVALTVLNHEQVPDLNSVLTHATPFSSIESHGLVGRIGA